MYSSVSHPQFLFLSLHLPHLLKAKRALRTKELTFCTTTAENRRGEDLPSNILASPCPSFCKPLNNLYPASGLASRSRKPYAHTGSEDEAAFLPCDYLKKRNINLSVGSRNKSHEFINVAHVKPVGEQGNRLLHLLGPQEVLNYFGHVPSQSSPFSKKTKTKQNQKITGTFERNLSSSVCRLKRDVPHTHVGKATPMRILPSGYFLPSTVTGGLTSRLPNESRLLTSFRSGSLVT